MGMSRLKKKPSLSSAHPSLTELKKKTLTQLCTTTWKKKYVCKTYRCFHVVPIHYMDNPPRPPPHTQHGQRE